MRIIPKIEIKNNTLVKGVSFEGLRVLGYPDFFIEKYEQNIADEFFLIDVTASLYGMPFKFEYLKKYCKNISVPITISGGLRSFDDVEKAFQSGADKVALNTYLFDDVKILNKISKVYGSQAITANLEVSKLGDDYKLYSEFGRERKNYLLSDWIKILIDNGIGEIVCSSIYNDGKIEGSDYNLLDILSKVESVPVVYSGGIKSMKEIEYIKKKFNVDGLLVGALFHYNLLAEEKKNIKEFNNEIGNSDFLNETNFFNKINEKIDKELKFNNEKKNIIIKNEKKLKFGILNLNNGNLFSITNFLKNNNFEMQLSKNQNDLMKSDILIISGDGNSNHCINEINNAKLGDVIKFFFEKKILIGICCGMQILFEKTYEDGIQNGLGLFNGEIRKIANSSIKLPNLGWREVYNNKKDVLGIDNSKFYFMHSFTVKNFNDNECLYFSEYKKNKIPSIFKKNNSYAFQFHPEKSGNNGLSLLKKIIEDI